MVIFQVQEQWNMQNAPYLLQVSQHGKTALITATMSSHAVTDFHLFSTVVLVTISNNKLLF